MNSPTNDTQSMCRDLYMTWSLIYISLSPVFALVIFLGCKQGRKPQPRFDSDVFTFNMAVVELFRVVGTGVTLSFFYLPYSVSLDYAGDKFEFMSTLGQTLFHILVCTERYLAVVHPIAYMRLKKKGRIIRDVCVTTVWLICFSVLIVYHFIDVLFIIFSVVIVGVISIFVVAFFSASVLCVLIRPGPGDGGRVDQSKRRAFYTMSLITVALLLKFVTLLVTYMIYAFSLLDDTSFCLLAVSSQWLNMPSIVVLPGLFLHRQVAQRKISPIHP